LFRIAIRSRMKFLTLGALASASSKINDIDTGDSLISARIEAYSCKREGTDKKLYCELEKHLTSELNQSPSELSVSTSPFGSMVHKKSRETLIELISTLNAAFPNYDFSSLRGEHFIKEELWRAVHQINSRLERIGITPTVRDQIWNAVDSESQLSDCAVYSFVPTFDANPFEEDGHVWSFTYLFYNKKKLKRIIMWTCSAQWKNDSLEIDFQRSGEEYCDSTGGYDMDAEGDFDMSMMMDYNY